MPEPSEQLHRRRHGVRRGTAVRPGVDAVVEGGHVQVEHHQAAQADVERRLLQRPVRGVGDHDGVGAEQVAVPLQQVGERRRADLLLALDQHDDPHAVLRSPRRQQGAQRHEVGDHPALVVGGAASVEPAVALDGLERPCGPGVLVAGRLDVLVRVEHHRRRSRRRRAASHHGRRPGAPVGPGARHLPHVVEARLAQERLDRVRAGLHVRLVERRRRHRRDADEVVEVGPGARHRGRDGGPQRVQVDRRRHGRAPPAASSASRCSSSVSARQARANTPRWSDSS